MKRKFSDRWVRGIKAAPSGKRVEYYDTMTPCFGVRVTDTRHKTYVLYLKFPGSTCATRREIGDADRLCLSAARKRAREWLELVELGVDPREKERATEAEARQKKLATFESVAEAWFLKIKHQRKADEVERDVRREFVARWSKRPVTGIRRHVAPTASSSRGYVQTPGARRESAIEPPSCSRTRYSRPLR